MFNKFFLYMVIVSTLICAGCVIEGKVVDENGEGLPAVKVALSGDQSRLTTTDKHGIYYFGDLWKLDFIPVGSYTVTPSKSGYGIAPVSRNVTITTQALGKLEDAPWPEKGVDFEASLLPNIPEEWTEIVPGPTEFMGRHLEPTCLSLPGTDPEFSFFAKGGTVNNLVIFFDGGGACWDSINCLYFPTCTQEVDETTSDAASTGGIFDTENPDNPFKDWSFVFIPYCTGDIHWGSGDYDYPDYLNRYGGGNVTIRHRGFDNFLVVLKWITENFMQPKKIFVTGSSAGSYGAILGFPYIKEAFSKSKVDILGDAGNGVISEDFHNLDINNWNIQPNLPAWIPGFNRPFSEYNIDDMYKMIANYYPHNKVAQYTTAWDWNQSFFYNVMINISDPNEWINFLPVWCDWHEQMIEKAYSTAEASNYRFYIASGTDHTIMADDKFYEEDSAGVPFVDWLRAMLANKCKRHRYGEIEWENVMCGDCGDPLTCP